MEMLYGPEGAIGRKGCRVASYLLGHPAHFVANISW